MDGGGLTRATPFGCVLCLFGLFSLVYCGVCLWGWFLAIDLEDEAKKAAVMPRLITGACLSGVIGVGLLWGGWKLAVAADMGSPRDPDRPMTRF